MQKRLYYRNLPFLCSYRRRIRYCIDDRWKFTGRNACSIYRSLWSCWGVRLRTSTPPGGWITHICIRYSLYTLQSWPTLAKTTPRWRSVSLKITAEVQHSGEFNLSVDLNIDTDRVTALYGASGSGKTTLLRVIAGLERCAGAKVRFNNEIWQNSNIFIPTHKRKIGYVFQHLHQLL